MIQWKHGIELKTENIMPILSIIYVLYNEVNSTANFGLNTLINLSTVIERIASVYAMEEYQTQRDSTVAPEEVTV